MSGKVIQLSGADEARKSNTQAIQTGPRGGRYYTADNGEKIYVDEAGRPVKGRGAAAEGGGRSKAAPAPAAGSKPAAQAPARDPRLPKVGESVTVGGKQVKATATGFEVDGKPYPSMVAATAAITGKPQPLSQGEYDKANGPDGDGVGGKTLQAILDATEELKAAKTAQEKNDSPEARSAVDAALDKLVKAQEAHRAQHGGKESEEKGDSDTERRDRMARNLAGAKKAAARYATDGSEAAFNVALSRIQSLADDFRALNDPSAKSPAREALEELDAAARKRAKGEPFSSPHYKAVSARRDQTARMMAQTAGDAAPSAASTAAPESKGSNDGSELSGQALTDDVRKKAVEVIAQQLLDRKTGTKGAVDARHPAMKQALMTAFSFGARAAGKFDNVAMGAKLTNEIADIYDSPAPMTASELDDVLSFMFDAGNGKQPKTGAVARAIAASREIDTMNVIHDVAQQHLDMAPGTKDKWSDGTVNFHEASVDDYKAALSAAYAAGTGGRKPSDKDLAAMLNKHLQIEEKRRANPADVAWDRSDGKGYLKDQGGPMGRQVMREVSEIRAALRAAYEQGQRTAGSTQKAVSAGVDEKGRRVLQLADEARKGRQNIITGPRGGRYYVADNGEHVYVDEQGNPVAGGGGGQGKTSTPTKVKRENPTHVHQLWQNAKTYKYAAEAELRRLKNSKAPADPKAIEAVQKQIAKYDKEIKDLWGRYEVAVEAEKHAKPDPESNAAMWWLMRGRGVAMAPSAGSAKKALDARGRRTYQFERVEARKAGTDSLPGGRAAGRDPGDFDPEQLEAGIAVEMEHTADPDVARDIAMDHLTESPDYYRELARMEAGLEARKGDPAAEAAPEPPDDEYSVPEDVQTAEAELRETLVDAFNSWNAQRGGKPAGEGPSWAKPTSPDETPWQFVQRVAAELGNTDTGKVIQEAYGTGREWLDYVALTLKHAGVKTGRSEQPQPAAKPA